MNMDNNLTVVDLFSGGGGFSEGFRQAGFEISYAVDYEERACETHEANMRPSEKTNVECRNVLNLEPSDFPQSIDILIGSPPCTEFSSAKNGGKGDIEEGMELVGRFMYFVAELEPEYWLMENVPRLANVDQFADWVEAGAVPHSDIPWLEGEGEIPINTKVLDAEKFGTPQRRSRLFSGNIPFPDYTHETTLDFGTICSTFPNPKEAPPERAIADPVYPNLQIKADDLTDHYYNSHLTDREAKEIRVRKENHSFYGKMSFPDNPDVPSRTVLAMNRRIARETLVYESNYQPAGFSKFRKPTIREIATIQGFPITYLFTGSSLAQKWRRVGDAVPPTISYQLARTILEEEGIDTSGLKPDVSERVPDIDFDLRNADMSNKGRRKLGLSRSFRHHVPYDDMREFRVDLETEGDPARHPLSASSSSEFEHPVRFKVKLYKGYAKEVESTELPLSGAMMYVDYLLEQHPDLTEPTANFLSRVDRELSDEVPDATSLQAIRSRRMNRDDPLEYELLELIAAKPESDRAGIVDEKFPYEDYHDFTINLPNLFGGTELPVRVLMKAIAANYVAHKLNHCAKWFHRNKKKDVYIPEDIDIHGEWPPSTVTCNESCGLELDCIESYFERASERIIGSQVKGSLPEYAE